VSNLHPLVQQLIDRRHALGLSQRAVAGRAGLAQPTLANIEAGISGGSLRTLEPWATALGLEIRAVERAGATT
jgi:transcriptional regulator with XRE-family HTH domain